MVDRPIELVKLPPFSVTIAARSYKG